jgi:hypothetical protein
MSARCLYRVIVRMLYDPDFAHAVYRDSGQALAGLDLSAREQSWLVQPDARAYRTDPMRRWRSLTALLEEFPATSAFILRRGREGSVPPEMELLDAFFSGPDFHRCIQDGGSMIFAFSEFLGRKDHGGAPADSRVAPLARLETAIARLRRSRLSQPRPQSSPQSPTQSPWQSSPQSPQPQLSSRLALAPRALILTLPAGTYELHRRISRALEVQQRPAVACLRDPRWSLPVLLDLEPMDEYLLVEKTIEEGTDRLHSPVRHTTITLELFFLLGEAGAGADRRRLAEKACALGAEPAEAEEIIDGLIAEGLLVSV